MIKSIEFPNRTFETKLELFRALKKHQGIIIDSKKSVKYSQSTRAAIPFDEGSTTVKDIEVKEGHSLHVINTTKILDSHNDVHINGLWSKSVKEQKGKIYFLADHDMSVGSIIAYPKDVRMRLMTASFKDLGFDHEGETQALVFEINKKDVRHSEAKHIIENKIDIEHSIRMSYVKIELAVNSDDEDFKAERAVWDKFHPIVANKDVADENGFFWAVREAKIHEEGSMVLRGSNHVTPMINAKNSEVLDEEEEVEDKNKEEKIVKLPTFYL
jgi:hypothetical protein